MPRSRNDKRRTGRSKPSDSRPRGERKDKRFFAHESSAPVPPKTLTPHQVRTIERLLSGIGILTGDRKENTGAPLIVGTTEIYRNQLFDALRSGEQVETDFVILDEAHYLADEERGHVWEEAIILSPSRIRLLLLSATVGRAEEFAAWIGEIRGTTVRVIKAGPRPVELRAGYLSRELQLFPLFGEDGRYNRELDQFARQRRDTLHRRRR